MATPDSTEELQSRLRRLLTVNRAILSRMAMAYVRTAQDRDDLLQEIAIGLWRALPAFRGECSERTFLLRIAHNRCLTFVENRRQTVSIEDAGFEMQDPSASCEEQLACRQQRERLLGAIRSLPLIHREVVLLTLEGLDYREISEVVGITESNVGARLSRARQQLKQALEDSQERGCHEPRY
jgi:RNA polymerase sigma-70 factor (ECF subfamily)